MNNDVTYLAIILALFALMFLLVKACDLIIGPDEATADDHASGGVPGQRMTPEPSAERPGVAA